MTTKNIVLGLIATASLSMVHQTMSQEKSSGEASPRAVGEYQVCVSRLHNLGTYAYFYKQKHGHYPSTIGEALDIIELNAAEKNALLRCSSPNGATYVYELTKGNSQFTIYCSGHVHAEANVSCDRPAYTSEFGILP